MEVDDIEMYRAAIKGDREAFEMIIRTMSRPLFAIAFGVLANREEAEDAVQDALVRAWKSRWRVREPEKFPAWIATIVRHRAHDLFRRRKFIPIEQQLDELTSDQRDPTPDAERAAMVRSALMTLPELHRSALMLRYIQRMHYAAIEETLGLSSGALRGILARGLAAMRKRLGPALATLI